jgi:hypothetical protein
MDLCGRERGAAVKSWWSWHWPLGPFRQILFTWAPAAIPTEAICDVLADVAVRRMFVHILTWFGGTTLCRRLSIPKCCATSILGKSFVDCLRTPLSFETQRWWRPLTRFCFGRWMIQHHELTCGRFSCWSGYLRNLQCTLERPMLWARYESGSESARKISNEEVAPKSRTCGQMTRKWSDDPQRKRESINWEKSFSIPKLRIYSRETWLEHFAMSKWWDLHYFFQRKKITISENWLKSSITHIDGCTAIVAV